MNNKQRNRLRWLIVNGCRFFLAVVFIFSGVVKLIDPKGTEYKIVDYGQAFGLSHLLPSLVPLFLSVVLAIFEFSMGINMVFAIHRKRTTRLLVLFLLIMTPLTLYLALTNPVSDCGCFGDALILTNWQTFGKNLVLLAAAWVTASYRRYMTRFVLERNQWMISLYTWFYGLLLASFNIMSLPIIDFRPYHIGSNIREKVEATGGEWVTYFLLEKDGMQKEFLLENYPDSTWTFVDSRTEEVHAPEMPVINDFVVTDISTVENVTWQILEDPDYQFLLISPRLEDADDGVMDRLAVLNDYCQAQGYQLRCLTASTDSIIQRWCDITGAEYDFFHADEEVLKTMIRSNPGLMLLHDGVVVNKWPSGNLPKEEDLTAPLDDLPLAHPKQSSYIRHLVRLLLWYLIPLLLWTLADRMWVAMKLKKRNRNRVIINQIKNKRNNEKEDCRR